MSNHTATRILAATALVVLAAAPIEAQTRSLTWTETTRMEAPGSLGIIMRLGGGGKPVESTGAIHLQGRAMIQEYGSSTFIADLDAGQWTTIDHDAKTYTTMTFEEMVQFSEAMVETAQDRAAAAAAETPPTEQPEVELEVRFSVESTRNREKVGQHNAQQYFVVGELKAKEAPEGVEPQEEGGIFYFLTELWNTRDVPAERELYEAFAKMLATDQGYHDFLADMGDAVGDPSQAVAGGLAAWDTNIAGALVKLGEEMEKIEGTTVRSVTVVAAGPEGVKPDRTALLEWEPATMGAVLGNAARNAGEDAARSALRSRTRGLIGGRRREETPPPSVQPLFRMTTVRDNLVYRESNDDVLAAVRARMSGYRQVTVEELTAQLQQTQ